MILNILIRRDGAARLRGHILVGVLSAAAAALVAHTGMAKVAPLEAEESQSADIIVVTALSRAIVEEVRRLPCVASTEDMEAAIVFRLSQTKVSNESAIEALGRVQGQPDLCANTLAAIDNVKNTLKRGGLRQGTAAIGGGNADAYFTAPSVGAGGGASNYGIF